VYIQKRESSWPINRFVLADLACFGLYITLLVLYVLSFTVWLNKSLDKLVVTRAQLIAFSLAPLFKWIALVLIPISLIRLCMQLKLT
jgi:hypothetical protein